jgi:hypothetical protein
VLSDAALAQVFYKFPDSQNERVDEKCDPWTERKGVGSAPAE